MNNSSNRILLLRSEKGLDWKYLIMAPSRFDPRKFKGYRYYKSFPHNYEGKEAARAYAVGVEKEERLLSLHRK